MNDKISDYIKHIRRDCLSSTLDLRYVDRVKISSKVELFRMMDTFCNFLSENLKK